MEAITFKELGITRRGLNEFIENARIKDLETGILNLALEFVDKEKLSQDEAFDKAYKFYHNLRGELISPGFIQRENPTYEEYLAIDWERKNHLYGDQVVITK